MPIDSIINKWRKYNIADLVEKLSPSDSVGIFFGCGSQAYARVYLMNLRLKTKLDSLGLHALIYLDANMQHQKNKNPAKP